MLTLLAGPPGAGKSTLAKQMPGRVIEFDDWVVERFGGTFDDAMLLYRQAYPASYGEFLYAVLEACANDDVVAVDTSIRINQRLNVLDFFRHAGVSPLHLVYVAVGWEEALRRNISRSTPRVLGVLETMHAKQQFPRPDEGWDSVHIIGAG